MCNSIKIDLKCIENKQKACGPCRFLCKHNIIHQPSSSSLAVTDIINRCNHYHSQISASNPGLYLIKDDVPIDKDTVIWSFFFSINNMQCDFVVITLKDHQRSKYEEITWFRSLIFKQTKRVFWMFMQFFCASYDLEVFHSTPQWYIYHTGCILCPEMSI